jgi:hypothetical protein
LLVRYSLRILVPAEHNALAVALSSGIEVAGTSLTISDNSPHTMSLSYASGFDTLYIYDDLVAGFGEPFHIDNFSGQVRGQVIPEPSTMLLLGSGLIGVWCWRKKRKQMMMEGFGLNKEKPTNIKGKGEAYDRTKVEFKVSLPFSGCNGGSICRCADRFG